MSRLASQNMRRANQSLEKNQIVQGSSPRLHCRYRAPAHHSKDRTMIKCAAILATLLTVSASAMAQDTSIAGTWVLTATEKLLPDGKRVPDYGPNPHGLAIFTA